MSYRTYRSVRYRYRLSYRHRQGTGTHLNTYAVSIGRIYRWQGTDVHLPLGVYTPHNLAVHVQSKSGIGRGYALTYVIEVGYYWF